MGTVVIGSDDTERTAALARAVRARRGAASVRGRDDRGGDGAPLTVVEAASADEAASAGFDTATSVVVIDAFPVASILRSTADATEARPELAVLFTGPVKPSIDAMVALASGARGYLPALSPPKAVAAAVDQLLAGEAVLPRCVASPLVQHLRWSGRGIVVEGHAGRRTELTNREWGVLVLLRQGRTTGEIARRLVVSNGTVRSHVAAIVRKLGATDRSAFVSPSAPS